MAVNGGHAGTKKGPNWGHVTNAVVLNAVGRRNTQMSAKEPKGRYRKRAVLANVPSFRFCVPGNIRMYPCFGFSYRGISECTLVLVFRTGEHPPKPPFSKPPFGEPPKMSAKERKCKSAKGHKRSQKSTSA